MHTGLFIRDIHVWLIKCTVCFSPHSEVTSACICFCCCLHSHLTALSVRKLRQTSTTRSSDLNCLGRAMMAFSVPSPVQRPWESMTEDLSMAAPSSTTRQSTLVDEMTR